MLYKLPNLCDLSVAIERETSLPSTSLLNVIRLTITYGNEDGWLRLFRGATLGRLESVIFIPESERTGDFLGAFNGLHSLHPSRMRSRSSVSRLMEPGLLLSPSIHADDRPTYSILLRRWMHLKGGPRYRYPPFSGDAEVEIPKTGRRPVPPVHHRCHGKGTRGPGTPLPESLRPSYALSSGYPE